MAIKPATTATETPAPEAEADANVLDTQSASVKRLIAKGKERGYITFDELNAVLPAEQNSSEQIEDIMAMLSEMGIQVVESEEGEDAEAAAAPKEEAAEDDEGPAGNISESSVSRTDDPVRMYLREMGTVELLSREGEIAIAKRIEAGRDMMIRGLCESPLTFRAIIAWHEALNNGRVLLRDVIDLEAMQAGNEPGAAEGFADAAAEELDEDEEGDGGGMSLAALEEKLKPEIFTYFEDIEKLYEKLAKIQQKRLDNLTAGGDVNSRSEKAYEKLRDELVAKVEQVRLHNNRIEELVAQLKVLNQRLNGLEGQILRLAEGAKVTREEFLQHYRGREMDPGWMNYVAALPGKGWKDFVKKFTPQVSELRAQIGKVASEGGLPIEEFRRVYTTVSRGERDSTRAKKEMIEANLRPQLARLALVLFGEFLPALARQLGHVLYPAGVHFAAPVVLQKLVAAHLGVLGQTQKLAFQPVQPLVQHLQLRHKLFNAVIMQPHLLNLGHQLIAQLFVSLFGARIHITASRQVIDALCLHLRELVIELLDLVEILENLWLQLFFQGGEGHARTLAFFVVIHFLRGVKACLAGFGIGLHGLQVDHIAQQHPAIVQRLVPGNYGAEGKRAFAKPTDHHVPPGLYALGDRNLALAGKQLHRTHLAQIHAHRVIRTANGGFGDIPRLLLVIRLFLRRGGGLGFLAFLRFHHLDAHFIEHRHDVFDLLGAILLCRQNCVQLVEGDISTLFSFRDQPLNSGGLRIQHVGIGLGLGGGGFRGGGRLGGHGQVKSPV